MTQTDAAVAGRRHGTAWLAVAMSLSTIVVAFLIVMLAGEYVGLGPLDLATADRLALGLWTLAPVVGGVLLRTLGTAELARAATTLGTIVGACVALFFLFGSGTGEYQCSVGLGALPRPIGCVLVGGLTGAGIAAGFLISGIAARRRTTILPGVALAGAFVLIPSLGAKGLFYEAVRCLN
jgi:hypothetical protein